ncbi:prephenate dehydrogenase [Evtepia sp.]|uniref:prephenate dehydrogenase n=1 Tax=Evtepia sp. TaxID=2773933 RepID=UPI003F140E0A
MIVGIIGLGLIGGSLAKAFCRSKDVTVLGWDTNRSIVEFAQIAEAIQAPLTEENLNTVDLLLLATYPEAVIEHMERLAPKLSKHTMVIDCAGTKEKVCKAVFPLAEQYGFRFLGGHPMAGTHNSGFKYSREDLFDGAPMVLVPPNFYDIRLLDEAKKMLAPVGFGRVSITTAADHDKRIAFTSQLAHVVSNAYVKSPTAREHAGFSAGSYKDLTRVAWLNPDMWAELFLENKEHLLFELNTIIENLTEYKTAMEQDDFSTLRQLLDDGRRIKEEVDGH